MERTAPLLLWFNEESTYIQFTCLKKEKKNFFLTRCTKKTKYATDSLKLLWFRRQELLPKYNWEQTQVAVYAAYLKQVSHISFIQFLIYFDW